MNFQENVEEIKRLITEVGLRYKVASKYTSFVGVDEKQEGLFSKQGYGGHFIITMHIKNQMPQNQGSDLVLPPHQIISSPHSSMCGPPSPPCGQSSNDQLLCQTFSNYAPPSVAPQLSAQLFSSNDLLCFTDRETFSDALYSKQGKPSQPGKDNLIYSYSIYNKYN